MINVRVFTLCLFALMVAEPAHAVCIVLPLERLLAYPDIAIIFEGSVVETKRGAADKSRRSTSPAPDIPFGTDSANSCATRRYDTPEARKILGDAPGHPPE
jgi:hypothetical protein